MVGGKNKKNSPEKKQVPENEEETVTQESLQNVGSKLTGKVDGL
jgi:hypothetical protein